MDVNGGGFNEQPEANGTFLNPTLTNGEGGGLQWQGIAEKLGIVVATAIMDELVEKGIDSLFGPSDQDRVNADSHAKRTLTPTDIR